MSKKGKEKIHTRDRDVYGSRARSDVGVGAGGDVVMRRGGWCWWCVEVVLDVRGPFNCK